MTPLGTVLIGAGRIGARYAADPVMAAHFRYATHAQVLADHPAFAFEAVVDPDEDALTEAREQWGVPHASTSLARLGAEVQPQVAVIATPPAGRLDILRALPDLRAVVVEKPLGNTLEEARAFIDACRARRLLVQVNLWRRADRTLRRWADGELARLIGRPQAAFGIYGNGVLNNGTHLVDLVEMLLGPVASIQPVVGAAARREGPLPGDVNLPFTLLCRDGLPVMAAPVAFEHYRENSLDIWGERGRVSVYQEGLLTSLHPVASHRAVQGAREIATDRATTIEPTAGDALYHLYDNLANALEGRAALWSDGEQALASERWVHALRAQAAA